MSYRKRCSLTDKDYAATMGEWAVQTVKQGLKKIPGSIAVRSKLNIFLFQYRMTPSSTTGKSPAELLNNRKMRSLLDLIHPNLQGRVRKKQLEMKARHDGNKAVRKFSCGDSVSVKNFASGPKWLHGIILGITGPVSYEVQLQDGCIVRRHVDHVITRQVQEVMVSCSMGRTFQRTKTTKVLLVRLHRFL